ncbi:MAG: STAS domain-containing protein [Chloroflexales bacterium]
MALNTRALGNVSVLDLQGRFDAHIAPAVIEWYGRLPTAQVVVNLAGVTFMDSSALAALTGGMKRCRQRGGDMRLYALQQPVQVIFELTRMYRAFEIFATEAEAVASFTR